MATLLELRTEIMTTINNPDLTATRVDKFINSCLKDTAGRVLLPKLESENTVDTVLSTNSVSIPSEWNFHRNLFQCQVEDNPHITVLNSLEQLERYYPDYKVEGLNGDIEYAVVSKETIVYYPIPDEAVTLVCGYYELPTTLVDDTDEPECIPIDFQEDLILYYVAWKVWQGVEDGVEGFKVNTNYNKAEYMTLRDELEDRVDTGQSRALPNRKTGWI